MKTLILITILMGAFVVEGLAQDTVQTRKSRRVLDSEPVIIQPPVPDRQAPKLNDRVEFTPENLVRLQPAEAPPALLKTLEEVKYKGWENGVLYRNIVNNQYMLELSQDREVKKYYFDQNGNPLEE